MNAPASAKPESVRTFLAILLGPEQLDFLSRLQEKLQAELPSDLVRWITREQLHITLSFLGYVGASQIEPLISALRDETGPGFELALEKLGCFPTAKRPNVIWVGITGQTDLLEQLQNRVSTHAQSFSKHVETRAFHPHLTIGRIRPGTRGTEKIAPLLQKISAAKSSSWKVNEFDLMRSVLHPKGAVYSSLATFPLNP